MAANNQVRAKVPLVPRKIISFDEKQLTAHSQVLDKELDKAGAMHDQLYVISVTGPCRTGKSFLINLMIHYLDYYCQHGNANGWKNDQTPITGIRWAKGMNQPVTKGIWMVLYPNLIERTRVVFLDCQGTADKNEYSVSLDNMIMSYSFWLSNMTIVNVKNQLDPRDLDAFGVCCTMEELQSGFEDLKFLVRDWEDNEEPFQLENLAQTTNSSNVKDSVRAILEVCSSCETIGLPHPGPKVTKANETDGITMDSIDGAFIDACERLFNTLLIDDVLRSTKTKNGYDFSHHFQFVGHQNIQGGMTQRETVIDRMIIKALEKAQNELTEYANSIAGRTFETAEEIDRAGQEAFQAARNVYQRDPKVFKHASAERKREGIKILKSTADALVITAKTKLEEIEQEKKLAQAKIYDANARAEQVKKDAAAEKKRKDGEISRLKLDNERQKRKFEKKLTDQKKENEKKLEIEKLRLQANKAASDLHAEKSKQFAQSTRQQWETMGSASSETITGRYGRNEPPETQPTPTNRARPVLGGIIEGQGGGPDIQLGFWSKVAAGIRRFGRTVNNKCIALKDNVAKGAKAVKNWFCSPF